ncbi:sigma 54-interacting transcriptional regulator [Fodinisporobacter ferrooxydans]|uniref:Sigma 54-interacting transcriptional regulator n=1 Tax=Fodinisporobacter ferrooxydans TaxID=2901836 RepID=A0ABY4CPC4_9BACL|nr:sigma 54-interacting transcriptional regulator [Alicyclobacillaceae bacterium MYW30-H2]
MRLKDHLLSILESFHDVVLVIAKDSTIAYVNQAYSRQFGVPVNKIIGRKLNEIESKARILEVLQTGIPLINDYSYVHSLKKSICANITPLIENGVMIGAVAIMKDISEIRDLQEQLERYKKYSNDLEEKLVKRNFALLESSSPPMQMAVNLARKVATTDATVLIYGESGVGKEVFAKSIHNASNREGQPFIAINMASIPENLFESELFGYEDGSFTGAKKGGKKGIFELANGGTLFLDEIGEMPLAAQAKILRVIQERTFQRIGGTRLHPLDIRIICATNRDLREQIRLGKFRDDLYYRLNVVPIKIPPLRERKEDIPFLVNHILTELNFKYNKSIVITDETYSQFEKYEWPGNVRELYNVIEHMIAVCTNSYFELSDIPEYINKQLKNHHANKSLKGKPASHETDNTLYRMVEQTEREMIEAVLKTSKNRSDAIQKLGISRKAFYAKLRKYGLL